MMEDVDEISGKLAALRAMGIPIAIDDYGTGFSSLRYLAQLPVTALKIDRSFVETMASSSESRAIVSSTITLAHALGLKVVAEGVENEEQHKLLRLLRCNAVQGFLFSRAVPADQIPELVRRFAGAG